VTGRYQFEDVGMLSHDSETGPVSDCHEYGVESSDAKESAYPIAS